MAKGKMIEKRPPRKDGAKRTRRQQQTYDNNLNMRARRYLAKREEHQKELKRLRRDNRDASKLLYILREELNGTAHETAELRRNLRATTKELEKLRKKSGA